MASVATHLPQSTYPKVTWQPLALLPLLAVMLFAGAAPWIFMWALAGSIFAGLKWLSFTHVGGFQASPTFSRAIGFLFLWPGMDAASFFKPSPTLVRPLLNQWVAAFAKIAFGALLFWCVARLVPKSYELLTGWIGMIGLVFMLHFGVIHLLALAWQRQGVDARPIMNAPILARSLADFWGRRWNLAFRDLAHTFIFRRVVSRTGVAMATMIVFLVSGILHDLAISIPARAGYGLPTLYFVLQGFGLLVERSRFGRAIGLGRGVRGRVFATFVTVAGACWLFHSAFVREVVMPMMTALHAI